jgi:DNA-binding NtrC family response regulator
MKIIPVRVLVLDDDESVCRRVSTLLNEAAYDVVTFTDAAEALAQAPALRCQVVMVDLRMPGHDEAELIRRLQAAVPQALLIGMAAFPELPQVLAAIRAGARDVLEKPIQAEPLFATLERLLAETGVVARREADYNRWLGGRLRAARSAGNLTLQDVAELAGLTSAQLSQIELGKTGTSVWTLARIASALRKSLPELLIP